MEEKSCKKIGEIGDKYVYLCPVVEEIEETLKDLDRLAEIEKWKKERKAIRKEKLEKLLGIEIIE